MSRFCVECNSKQVTERETRIGFNLRIYLYCNACRNEVTIFEGHSAEGLKFKRLRRAAKRRAS